MKHIQCSNCGYDMCGPEYLANTVDSSLASESMIYQNKALLELNAKPYEQITCPFCKSTGTWTT